MMRTRLIAGPRAGLVMSAVTATLLTLIAIGDTFFEPLRVTPGEPAPITLRLPPLVTHASESRAVERLVQIAPVVARGERVTDPMVSEYVRLHEQGRRPVRVGVLASAWFIYFLVAAMMTTYLRRFSASYGTLLRTQVGLLALIVGFAFAAKLTLLLTPLSPLVLPVAALPLWVALYFDRRTAFMVGFSGSFVAASLADFSLDVLLTFLAGSLTVTLVLGPRRRNADILTAGAAAAAGGAVVVAAAGLLTRGPGAALAASSGVAWLDVAAAAVGGFLPGVLGVLLQGPVGRMLGTVSRSRLIDLSDLSQPLLSKMAREAPGSWEHARAMANLAEAAASAIGADGLLTRVGAYYHDLGKTCQSKYFIENLDPGESSPHEALPPDVSADAIMAHVVEGVRILRDGGIPEAVVEFAYTHHGTSVIEYFWHKCLSQGNPKGLSESFFRYPGMRPRTRETAILMLVDAIEAASRTIAPPERERFEEMVNRILFVKLRQGQLDESGLTLEDLRVMSKQLVDTLVKANHHRIRYPWQDARDRGEAPLPVPGGDQSDDQVKRAVGEALEHRADVSAAAAEASGRAV
jgi:cyclic-di-AMP phosphodiesterase PgpH